MIKSAILLVIMVVLPAMTYAQSKMQDFARYQVILQRRPFGAVPVRVGPPAPPPTPEEDPFKNYRLVGITRGDTGDLSVGVADIGSNPPKSVFLNMGETYDGLTLLDADFELEGALIRKASDSKWLYLGGTPGGGGVAAMKEQVMGPAGGVGAEASKGAQSYIERMRARRESVRTTVIEPPKLEGEALQKHLQEYNMELIRKAAKGEEGGPPLPIQLTQEQDQQLVEEGVLPPQ